jgi:hypothetical protein
MTSEKLRPCPNPWCKTNRPQRIRTELTFAGVVRSRVECTCGVKGPRCDTEDEAAAAWNRRPVEDALVEALEDVDSTLCVCRHCIPPKGCNCDIHAAHRLIDAALKLVKEGRNG